MTTVFGPTVKADVLRGYVASLLVTTGYTATDAQEIADALVEADLRGVVSHGTMHVPNLLKRTKLGLVNTRPELRTLSEAECYVRCYGGWDPTVTVTKVEPRPPRYELRVSGEDLRREFEARIEARTEELMADLDAAEAAAEAA